MASKKGFSGKIREAFFCVEERPCHVPEGLPYTIQNAFGIFQV
jgi:hypothetical protein